MSKRVKGSGPRGRHYIAEWRNHRGYTQQKLAELMNTTNASVSRVETYESAYTQDFLEACAKALVCRPEDLIKGPPNETNELQDLFNRLSLTQRAQAIRVIQALADEVDSTNSAAPRNAGHLQRN